MDRQVQRVVHRIVRVREAARRAVARHPVERVVPVGRVDPVLAQEPREGVAPPVQHLDGVEVVRALDVIRQRRRQREPLELLQVHVVAAVDLRPPYQERRQLAELGQRHRGGHVVHDCAVAETRDVELPPLLRDAVLVAALRLEAEIQPAVRLPAQLGAVEMEHRPVPADQDLHRVERPHPHLPERPDRLPLVEGADARRRILDDLDPLPVAKVHDRVHLAGNSPVVEQQQRLRLRRNHFLDILRAGVQRPRVHVAEHQLRAVGADRIAGADEADRRNDDLVARRDVQQVHRGEQPLRAAVRRKHQLLRTPDMGRELLLERGDALALPQPVRREHLFQRGELLFPQGRLINVDHIIATSP